MTVTDEQPQPVAPAAAADTCLHCGASLQPGQEWCLECGAARTLVHRPPDWRIALGAVAIVVLLGLAGVGIAVVDLSSSANRELQSGPITTSATSTASTAAAIRSTPPRARPIASWPVGLSGWTVVLRRVHSRAAAEAAARKLAGQGIPIGVLESAQHPHLRPGYWVVFSGRYPRPERALAAAQRLRDRGLRAEAREVAPPGGL